MSGLFSDFNPMPRLAANQHGLADSSAITKGTLISFNYPMSMATQPNVIHDPYPMVIVTDVWPQFIRGINLHYLTFPYLRAVLTKFGGNASFSYFNIRSDPYMANSFRMYYRAGVKRPRKLDAEWLKSVMAGVRSFEPGEIEKIRAEIQRQIQSRLQAKAKQLTSYEDWRRQLTESQKRQFRGKVSDIQNTLTRGAGENLIQPSPGGQPVFDEGMPGTN